MVTLTLVYVFSPLDLIPDYIPGVGLLDDASIVGLCIAAIKSDLEAFKAWAKAHLKQEEEVLVMFFLIPLGIAAVSALSTQKKIIFALYSKHIRILKK